MGVRASCDLTFWDMDTMDGLFVAGLKLGLMDESARWSEMECCNGPQFGKALQKIKIELSPTVGSGTWAGPTRAMSYLRGVRMF